MTWYLGFTWLFIGVAFIERLAGLPREVWQFDVLVAFGFAVLDAIRYRTTTTVTITRETVITGEESR